MAEWPSDRREQVRELTWSLCAGTLEERQYGVFEELLAGDVELRREYLRQSRLISDCQVLAMPERLRAARCDDSPEKLDSTEELVDARSDGFETAVTVTGRPSPVLGWLGRSVATFERPVAWSIMAVAVCFYGAFAFLAWNLRSSTPSSIPADDQVLVATVGRMANVLWTAKDAPRDRHSEVLRGEPLRIDAGVLEMQLRQGAMLLIEGPAEWSIDGDNLATLHRGKLVAKVPQRAVGFSLRTPSAEIVDLGTEFGVEVRNDRASSVAVFEGEIRVQTTDSHVASKPVRLVRGQGAVVSADASRIQPASIGADRFVRSISQQLLASGGSHQVLAWYRLGEDDAALGAVLAQPSDLVSNASKGTVQAPAIKLAGQRQNVQDTQAPNSSRALRFDPDNGLTSATTAGIARLNDNFVLEAWVRTEQTENACIAYLGNSSQNGFGLYLFEKQWMGIFGGKVMLNSGVVCEPGKWTHLALVRENGRARIFVDGRASDSVWLVDPDLPDDVFSIGGFADRNIEIFSGDIDEVRLMQLRRLFDPELLLCK